MNIRSAIGDRLSQHIRHQANNRVITPRIFKRRDINRVSTPLKILNRFGSIDLRKQINSIRLFRVFASNDLVYVGDWRNHNRDLIACEHIHA